jgi:hypothetical protein
MQGRFHGYTALLTQPGEQLNKDAIGMHYKDFVTGPRAQDLQTWGAFGVDNSTGIGRVSGEPVPAGKAACRLCCSFH